MRHSRYEHVLGLVGCDGLLKEPSQDDGDLMLVGIGGITISQHHHIRKQVIPLGDFIRVLKLFRHVLAAVSAALKHVVIVVLDFQPLSHIGYKHDHH